MRKLALWLLTAVALAVGPGLARAQNVLFETPLGNLASTISPPPFGTPVASPFTVAVPATLGSAVVYVSNNNAASTVACEVWSGGTIPTTLLATGSLSLPGSGSIQTVAVAFTAGPQLQPGTSYWLAVRTLSGVNNVFRQTAGNGTLATFPNGVWQVIPNNSGLSFRILSVPPVPGACCNPTSTGCTQLSSAECANFGGIYRGDGSLCAVPQCFPVGGCCRGALCELTTQPGCLVGQIGQPAGRWLGAGTACSPAGSPNACCSADFNGSGARDVSDIFAFLSEWFAGCP